MRKIKINARFLRENRKPCIYYKTIQWQIEARKYFQSIESMQNL